VVLTANPISFTANFTNADYSNPTDVGTAEVSTFQIGSSATVSLQTPNVTADAGLLTPTIQSGYYLQNGVYVLGQPPIANSGQGIGSSWVPGGTVFQGQLIVDPNGNQQIALTSGTSQTDTPAWNSQLNGTTFDGIVQWRNVGVNTFSVPTNWIMILNLGTEATVPPPTGEVGNVDPNMLYGLVAPRLDQVWEVSGGDQDFIFGLY